MVGQSLKDINPKQLKLAKQLLAVFEVMGIDEVDLTEVANLHQINFKIECIVKPLNEKIDKLNEKIKEQSEQIAELQEFKDSVIRVQKNETSAKTEKKDTFADILRKNFDGKVEEFNPNGK